LLWFAVVGGTSIGSLKALEAQGGGKTDIFFFPDVWSPHQFHESAPDTNSAPIGWTVSPRRPACAA
jgi:hypothetical protein